MRLPFLVAIAILSTVLLAAPASTKDKKPEDPDKRILRSEVPTGFWMSKNVCNRRRERAEIETQNQANNYSMAQSQRASEH